jgi:hypothetical protein
MMGLKLSQTKPKTSRTVPTNWHTTIQNNHGPISARFDDDPNLFKCETAQPRWILHSSTMRVKADADTDSKKSDQTADRITNHTNTNPDSADDAHLKNIVSTHIDTGPVLSFGHLRFRLN